MKMVAGIIYVFDTIVGNIFTLRIVSRRQERRRGSCQPTTWWPQLFSKYKTTHRSLPVQGVGALLGRKYALSNFVGHIDTIFVAPEFSKF